MTRFSRSPQEYIARAIDEAERRNDQAILIEINTPGGLVDSTRKIIEKITNSTGSSDYLRHAKWKPRGIGRILYSGIGRHCGDGSGNQHRRGASGASLAAANSTT